MDNDKLIQQRSNWRKIRPTGILIQDSYNNISFPITIIQIDNNKANVGVIETQFFTLYNQSIGKNNILPWHYIIEFYENNYIVHNTRPINLIYPKTMLETKEDSITNKSVILNDTTSELLTSSYDIENMISILLIGDSNKDVYTKRIYKTICEFVITPISRYGLFSPTLYTNILLMNIGANFKPELLKPWLYV